MNSKRVYLCRHADYIRSKEFPSGMLTLGGFDESHILGRYLGDVWRVNPNEVGFICSTSTRSLFTTYAVVQGLGAQIREGNNFFSDQKFREINFPPAVGQIEREIMPALEATLNKMTTPTVVAVLHGSLNRGILTHLKNARYKEIMGKCSLYALDFTNGQWTDMSFYCDIGTMKTRLESVIAE